jgi:DNA-binding transcriptional LysR family regulator
LVLAMGPDHPLATRKRVPFADLDGQPFVGFRVGSAVRSAVDRALVEAGVTPRLAFETNDLSMMRAVVARGLGVAVVPETVAEWGGPGMIARPLTPQLGRSVALVWRRDRHQPPTAAAFVDFVREEARRRLRRKRRAAAAGG